MAKRRANGEGKLRKRDGRWEGRYTTEHAPGTDKAIYRDVLGRIQEETHRFAVTFHQDTRAKSSKRSALDGIEGLGEARRRQLLKHFGTVGAIRQATEEELAAVVPRNVAGNIVRHFAVKGRG